MVRMIKLDHLSNLRRMLHSFFDCTMGELFKSMKAALPVFWASSLEKGQEAQRVRLSQEYLGSSCDKIFSIAVK
jgi:hypothetical protein